MKPKSKPTFDEALFEEELAQLDPGLREAILAKIAAERAASAAPIRFKVSQKKALSVIGLQRFPVTLYLSQWERLLDASTLERLRAFIEAHRGELATKG